MTDSDRERTRIANRISMWRICMDAAKHKATVDAIKVEILDGEAELRAHDAKVAEVEREHLTRGK